MMRRAFVARWAAALVAFPLLLLCGTVAGQPPVVEDPAEQIRELLALERIEEAVAEGESLALRFSDSPIVSTALAEALFRSGRLEEAEDRATALVSGPAPPGRALLLLGRLRAARGRYGEARELARRAVAAAPDDPMLLYWASGLASNRADGIALLSRYLELSDDDDPDRIASARGTREMLAALGERRVWSLRNRPDSVSVPLQRLRDASGATQGYVIEIRLRGRRKPVPVLLDTGSSGLFLRERLARKAKFRPLATETVFGGGGDQRHRSRRGCFAELSVGELSFSEATATLTKDALDPQGRYQGVLGVGIFAGYRITIDLKRLRLVLERDDAATDAGTPYWMISGHLLVQAEANGDRQRLFLLDTGATTTVLAARYAASLDDARIGGRAEIHGFGGRRLGAYHVEGVTVRFQGLGTPPGPLSTVDLALRNRLLGIEIAGYLGLDLLDEARIVIDARAGTVAVQRTTE